MKGRNRNNRNANNNNNVGPIQSESEQIQQAVQASLENLRNDDIGNDSNNLQVESNNAIDHRESERNQIIQNQDQEYLENLEKDKLRAQREFEEEQFKKIEEEEIVRAIEMSKQLEKERIETDERRRKEIEKEREKRKKELIILPEPDETKERINIRFKLPNNNSVTRFFLPEHKILYLMNFIEKNYDIDFRDYNLVQTFPKIEYSLKIHGNSTLQEIGITDKQFAFIVQKI